MNCPFSFLTFRLQKFESDSEEDDATTAATTSPLVQVKEELPANDSISQTDVEMLPAEDVGNNVTICHDTDDPTGRVDDDGGSGAGDVEVKTEDASDTNLG